MQFEVFVSRIGISHIIVSLRLSVGGVDLPGTVVAELVHEAILHAGKDQVIDTIAIFGDVVFFVDMGVYTTTDTHHPQEFVDIVTGVTTDTTVDDQHVVDVESVADLEGLVLGGTHSETNSGNVGIVPSVVINQGGSIGKSSDLIPVIPPTHDDAFLLGVHSQPVVGLSVIIDDVFLAVVSGGEYD